MVDAAQPSVTYHLVGLPDEPAGLLPNPRYEPQPPEAAVTGRQRALGDLVRWLAAEGSEDAARTRVVVGDAGSGKTTLLRALAGTSDIADRVDALIDARGRLTAEVFADIATAAWEAATTAGDLVRRLPRTKDPVTILIDGLDEAVDPAELARSVLRPLCVGATGRLRLLIATSPALLAALGGHPLVVNLDAGPYLDAEGLRAYVRSVLVESRPDSAYRSAAGPLVTQTAAAIAEVAGTSYLMAGVMARTAATGPVPTSPLQWRAGLPQDIRVAVPLELEQRLGDQAERARELLLPLAYAEGPGLPWEDVWPRLANALTPGRRYSDDDVAWLLDAIGEYVTESCVEGRSAYRLAHRTLAGCLVEGRDHAYDQTTIVRTLGEQVPTGPDGRRDWARAHPYTRVRLVAHAARTQAVDELLTDGLFLLAAPPEHTLAALAAARSTEATTAGAVFQHAVTRLRAASPDERAAYLELAARCGGAPDIAGAISAAGVPRPWSARWSAWERWRPPHRLLSGPTSGVLAVAVGQLEGQPVVVAGGDDRAVRRWNLATGEPIGHPMSGHTDAVTALATDQLDDQPVVVSGGDDRTVHLWDLATGEPIGHPMSGHTGGVTCLAVGRLGAQAIAVSGSDDQTVRLWNVPAGTPHGGPMTGHTGAVTAVTVGEVEGHGVAISGGRDGVIRVWNLATRRAEGELLGGHTGAITSVAFGHLDGEPVAVSGSDDRTIRVWNLITGAPIGTSIHGHTDTVATVTIADIDGRPVIVSGGADRVVRFWNPVTGAPLGEPLIGHTGGVTAVATTHLDGQAVVASAGHDHTVRVWQAEIEHVGEPFTGHTDAVMSVALCEIEDAPAVVSGSADHDLRVWDVASGHLIGRPLVGHTGGIWSIATGTLSGRPIAVSGGADHRIRVWDLVSHQPIGQPFAGHTGWIWSVALGEVDGQRVVVSGSDDHSVRVWELGTGRPVGNPLIGHTGGVTAVAFGHLGDRAIAVSGSRDHSMRVWNLATGNPIGERLTGHTGGVWAVALGHVNDQPVAVSGGDDRTVRVWDLNTGALIGRALSGHTGAVVAVALGELDGVAVAVTGSDDHTVRVWDLESRRPLGRP
ncbi:hypothetical protein ACFQX7_06980 [Luedemannella flava]